MLNKGPQLAAGVAALDRLLERMGEHQVKKTPTLRALRTWFPVSKGMDREARRRAMELAPIERPHKV